ncbi:(E3-independent) E2 ubiquitin-conjugating enzyme [Ranunculus cassubicifolius]
MFLSDSDCDTSSESSYNDYLDDMDSMYGGQAQSILSNLERSIGRIDDFLAFEKGFIHGDIVCFATDPSGQLGRVVAIDMVVDLETFHGENIKEVNCKNLLKICPLVVGDYVVHGPWLGRVRRVVDRLTIQFEDGAKCELTAVNPDDIRPVCPSMIEDSQYPYYPGQRVHTRLSGVSKSARWLGCGQKENISEGIVCHVEAGIVYVDWVAPVVIGCDMNLSVPPSALESKDLTLLSCFQHANWQLGDWCLLSVHAQGIMDDHAPYSQNKVESRLMEGNQKSCCGKTYTIVKKKTKLDVLWQDGTCSTGLDSQSLLPVNSVGDHEFWPDQFVLEKSSGDDPHIAPDQRLGIVRSVDAKERTVRLKWKSQAGNQGTDSVGMSIEETVSVYELVEHPEYSFAPGDIIFRLENSYSTIQADEQSECTGPLISEKRSVLVDQLGDDFNKSKPNCYGSLKSQNKFYLSCIGNVISFKDEGVIVRWASGITSKVGPCEIVGIDKYEDSVGSPALHEQSIEDKVSSEMLEYDKQLTHGKDKDVLEYTGVDGTHNKDTWETRASFIPEAAFGFFKNITVSLFGSNGSTSVPSSLKGRPLCNLDSSQPPSSIANVTESFYEKEVKYSFVASISPSVPDSLQSNLKQQEEESREGNEAYNSSACKEPKEFKQFDTVAEISDHHFVHGDGNRSILPQVKRGLLKKIQQEWTILEKNLPDNIYVRVCEEKIDLLRAVIVGAPGTPYHDGLFVFDFYLPHDYPNVPPMVHYHSGGMRLNPNLYESGKICLSLLNTWMGTGTESWNPGSSTILQVLLSLQALVLNDRPYFNEAGYDTQIGKADGEKNSVTYNENAFLLSCKSMLYISAKPPKHFEELVEQHFRRRSHSILLACNAYMDGAPVGCAIGSGAEGQQSSSTGFKIMLAKLFPKLVSGFTDKGIDCSQFLGQDANA